MGGRLEGRGEGVGGELLLYFYFFFFGGGLKEKGRGSYMA